MDERGGHSAGKTALFGMFTALAMLFGWLESLLPLSIGIPGVKLGLANLVTMICLYRMGLPAAALVSLSRILLTGATFGSMASMLYSLAGGALSLLVMSAAMKSGRFSETGVSVAGGAAHNLGQLAAAALVVENAAVFWYFPVLLLAGTAAGTAIGFLSGAVLRRLPEHGE